MKWQQRVRIATGLGCWQITLHLMVIGALVVGWKTATLIPVGVGLCLFYLVTVLAMLVLQRSDSVRLRSVGDFLEELTTSWYFGTAMIVLWLSSQVVDSHLMLAAAGLAMIAGPALYSLLVKEKPAHFSNKHTLRR